MVDDNKDMRILVIEDEQFTSDMIKRMFKEAGYLNVRIAEDGEAGLQAVMKANPPFDVAFVDLEMPKVDGFGFLRMLGNHEMQGIRDLPAIVLSGHADQSLVVKAAKIGIHGYLVKPVSLQRLVNGANQAVNSPPLEIE